MKKILPILLLFITANTFAINYYVSSSTGNNSNNGLTPATAWKTLSKLYSANLLPGDNIHLKRGDIWYNQTLQIKNSGTAGNPITYKDYGVGNLPEISGMGTLDSTAVWVNLGGNIWSTTLSSTIIPNWGNYHRLQRLYINNNEVLGSAKNISTEVGTSVPDTVRFHYDKGTKKLKLYSNVNPNMLKIEFAFKQHALYFAWWAGVGNKV